MASARHENLKTFFCCAMVIYLYRFLSQGETEIGFNSTQSQLSDVSISNRIIKRKLSSCVSRSDPNVHCALRPRTVSRGLQMAQQKRVRLPVKSGNINERYHEESRKLDQSSRCFSSMARNIKRFPLLLSGNNFNFNELAKINYDP